MESIAGLARWPAVHRALALVLATLAATPTAQADNEVPADADAWCAEGHREVLVRDADGIWRRIAGDLPRDDPEGMMRQVWRGDLDGDGRKDLILRWLDGCGTRECMHEAFVSCRDGSYAAVFDAPLYAARVRVKRRKRGWARIDLETVGDYYGDRERERGWSRYQMTAFGYR
jgi:hypothetical protein